MKFFKIWNKKNKHYEGVYSRAYHDEYDFDSPESARNSNVHNTYHDTDEYEIHEYERTDEYITAVPQDEKHLEKTAEKRKYAVELDELGKKYPEDDIFKLIMRKTIWESFKDFKGRSK